MWRSSNNAAPRAVARDGPMVKETKFTGASWGILIFTALRESSAES
jgi:hypothetical protein